MKVYNQNSNKIKRNNAKVWYTLLAVLAVASIALVVTLAVAGRGNTSVSSGENNTGTVTTKPTEYVLPFKEYTVAREASIDKLVYMPAINMWKTHNGVDFLPGSDANVRVMADGTVKSVEQSSLEGWVVTVDHGDGLVSVYKSLGSATVKADDKVNAGDAIGTAGAMITESDIGDHVHLEITKGGKIVDPLDYLNTNAGK